MDVIYVLAISILLQFTAAFLALRLIRITGKRIAWILIAAAISLMAIRRSITFFQMLSGEAYQADLPAELVALFTTVIVLAGVALIAPLFLSIKKSEEAVRKINRSLKMLLLSNQAIIRAIEESTLIKDVCRVIAEDGGYRFAWVGFAEQDEEKTVRPVAYAGHEEGYLDTVNITWSDTEQGCYPTSKAIRTGKHFICRNISTDPHYAPWRNEATRRGYASSISLPLIGNGQTFGALTIYAEEPDAFDEEEMKLLTELANDLAYGIMALRSSAKRKQAEEQTKQLQEYLQLQIERMPIGLIVWDTEFRVQSWNPEAENIFGFTAEEAFGKHPYDLIVPKEVQPHVDDIWRRLLEGDTTAHSINKNITKDGRTIICEWSNTPLKKADGTVEGILSMVQDITERKEMEEALRASEEKHKTLFKSSGEGILIADIETKEFKYANPAICKMLGYNEEELLRLGVSDIHPKDALEHVISEFEAQARGEKILVPDIPCLRKDGKIIYADINTTKILLDGKECNLGFFTDITERRQAEEALHKSEEDLKKRVKELEEFYNMAVGRELRMKELKEEIESLKKELSRYK